MSRETIKERDRNADAVLKEIEECTTIEDLYNLAAKPIYLGHRGFECGDAFADKFPSLVCAEDGAMIGLLTFRETLRSRRSRSDSDPLGLYAEKVFWFVARATALEMETSLPLNRPRREHYQKYDEFYAAGREYKNITVPLQKNFRDRYKEFFKPTPEKAKQTCLELISKLTSFEAVRIVSGHNPEQEAKELLLQKMFALATTAEEVLYTINVMIGRVGYKNEVKALILKLHELV